MKSEIEDVGVWKKKIKFEIPDEEVKAETEKTFSDIAKTVQLPGFRRGHVPRAIVERQLGKKINEEVQTTLIENSVESVIKEHHLHPLDRPKIENQNFETGQPFTFEVEFEVKPEVQLGEIKGLAIERESAAVAEKDIDKFIGHLRERYAKLEPAPGAALQKDDEAVCSAEVISEGVSAWKQEHIHISAQDNGIGGFEVPGLGEKFIGKSTGAKMEFDITIPNDFENDKFHGKSGKLTVNLLEVEKKVLPELNEEFLKTINIESLEELKSKVTSELEKQFKQSSDSKLRSMLFDKLIEMHPMECPVDFLARQTEAVMHGKINFLGRLGMTKEMVMAREADLRMHAAKEAEREMKVTLILEKVCDKARIFVTEEEVERHVREIAPSYRKTPSALKQELEEAGRLDEIRFELRQNKAVDYLISVASVTDVERKEEPEITAE